jgi:hypothetical protein
VPHVRILTSTRVLNAAPFAAAVASVVNADSLAVLTSPGQFQVSRTRTLKMAMRDAT